MKEVSLNAQSQRFFSHGFLTEARHRLAQWETLMIYIGKRHGKRGDVVDNADWTGLLSMFMGAGEENVYSVM